MALSQIFVLSPRGDTIISKEFRGDALPNAAEVLFRKVKFWDGGDAPPVFQADGAYFLYIRKNGLLFGATTRFNLSPSLTLELLHRMAKVFKDYCGILSEESIRKNFILVYELLDDMMDYGYAQVTSTECLKSYVYNEPILVESAKTNVRMSGIHSKTTPSTAVHKPIGAAAHSGGKQKNEIFVDILERLNVLFSASGYMVNSTIDGCIQMKSYLCGNPELKLALNSDLTVGKGAANYGSVVLDDCNFHECVRLDEFETFRTLTFHPPDGEFALLNYRVTTEFRAPFRVFPTVDEVSPTRIEVTLTARAEIPEANYAATVVVKLPLPRSTVHVSTELPTSATGQTAEYSASDKRLVWTIKRFPGSTEQVLRLKITLAADGPFTGISSRKELGPVSMGFEIPMYNVSNLQVRYLRIAEQAKQYNPYRWVRYVTQASSYVIRL